MIGLIIYGFLVAVGVVVGAILVRTGLRWFWNQF